MPLIEWNQELALGCRPMDADHLRLLGMVNELHEDLLAGNSLTLIFAQLERLTGYAATHFRHEERLMEESAYPERFNHLAAHRELESKIKEMLERLDAGEPVFTLETTQLLRDWLLTHIKTMDKEFGDYLTMRNPG